MASLQTFEELETWKACRAFRIFIAKNVTPKLLNQREYSLADQLKRSSRSTTHNIAEGYGRFHYRDNYKFCSIARGSLNEALDQVICANDDELSTTEILTETRQLFDHAAKVLNGYMSYLAKSATKSQ